MTVLGAALNNEVVPGSCQGAMHPGADECWTAEMKPCVSTASMMSLASTRAGSFDSSSAGGRYASESHSVPSSESFSDELSDSSSSSRLSDVAFKARRGAKEPCPPLHRGSSPAESQCALKASATHSERSFLVRSMARQPCLRFGLPLQASRWRRRARVAPSPEEHDGAGEPAFEVRLGAKERCSPPSMSHAERRAASKSSSGSSASSSGASELAFQVRKYAKERCSVETDCRSFVADSSYGGDIEIESLGSSGAEFQQRSISRMQEDDSDEETWSV